MQDENARIFLRVTVAKKQQLGVLVPGNSAIYPKKLIPILNRLLRLLPPCIKIIQVPIGRLHIVIIYTFVLKGMDDCSVPDARGRYKNLHKQAV